MMGHEANATLGTLSFCDVLIGCYPTAIRQGALRNGQSKLVVLAIDKHP